MKKIILSCLVILALFSVPFTVFAAKEVKVEVLYMNHGPLLSTLNEIKTLFSKYGGKITVSWHDVETQEGEKFMAQKKIKGHIPLVIWMDNYVNFQIDGKEIIFAGFPTGKGPYFFQGKWTMEDLRKALDQMTNKK
jgi:hypothetical protein